MLQLIKVMLKGNHFIIMLQQMLIHQEKLMYLFRSFNIWFCHDYARVIRNIPITLELTGITNFNNVTFGSAAYVTMDFNVTEILLQIEQSVPNDKMITSLNDYLSKTNSIDAYYQAKECDFYSGHGGTKISLPIGTKSGTPRYFIIACKDPAKNDSLIQNFGKLENGGIENIKIIIDSQEYPNNDQSADFIN